MDKRDWSGEWTQVEGEYSQVMCGFAASGGSPGSPKPSGRAPPFQRRSQIRNLAPVPWTTGRTLHSVRRVGGPHHRDAGRTARTAGLAGRASLDGCWEESGGRPWNRTRRGSPRRSYSPLPHLAARRPRPGGRPPSASGWIAPDPPSVNRKNRACAGLPARGRRCGAVALREVGTHAAAAFRGAPLRRGAVPGIEGMAKRDARWSRRLARSPHG
jgi:hypothetical protein